MEQASKEKKEAKPIELPPQMSRKDRLAGILRDHGKTMRKARALTQKILYNDKGV
jgi:hypothetical protein